MAPGIGETLAFANPPNEWEPNFYVDFPIRLTVAEIIHHVDDADLPVTIFFEPMDLESEDSTKNLKRYFKKGFGLSVEKFRRDDESLEKTGSEKTKHEIEPHSDLFDDIWICLWFLIGVIWPTWEFSQYDPPLNFGQCIIVAAFFLFIFGIPLDWLMTKLRAPVRRLFGLTISTASDNYQIRSHTPGYSKDSPTYLPNLTAELIAWLVGGIRKSKPLDWIAVFC